MFPWGPVVGLGASGRWPFGKGTADALFYRIVHEQPALPELPDPLATLVPAAAIWLTVLGTVVVADALAEPGDV